MLGTRNVRQLPSALLVASLVTVTLLFFYVVQKLGLLWALAAFVIIPSSLLLLPLILTRTTRLVGSLRWQFSWWHILWLLLFLSDFTFRTRNTTDINSQAVDTSAAYRIALVALTALALVFRLGLPGAGWLGSLVRGLLGPLTLYAVLCGISTAWSVYPAWTFYKSIEYFTDLALLAAILVSVKTETGWGAVFNWNYALQVLLVGSAWVEAFFWPKEAFQEKSRGLFSAQLGGVMPKISSNGLGELGAIIAVVALSRMLLRRREASSRVTYIILFVSGVTTLIFSQTRSAVLGFIVGAALVFYFARRTKLMILVLVTSVILFMFTSAGFLTEQYLRRGQTDEQVNDLSGRVDYWEAGWQQLRKHPYTGLGAYTARFTVLAKIGEGDTSSIHNAYMEVILGLGPIGLIPILVAILGTWRWLLRFLRSAASTAIEHPVAVDCVGLLAVLTVRSFFTVAFVWHPPLSFLVVLGYAEFIRRQVKCAR
jgi:O-antigen ligase